MHIPTKSYNFTKTLVKSQTGALLSDYLCTSEANLEQAMGRKKAVNSLDLQRNFLNYKKLGDKSYASPEYSERFFKTSIVNSYLYGPIRKIDKRSLKEQLGEVKGIFSAIMENPLIKKKI